MRFLPNPRNTSLSGFTMIETILVVGIISILGKMVELKTGELICKAKNSVSATEISEFETVYNTNGAHWTELRDILQATFVNRGKRMFWNHCKPADINGDGVVDGDDLTAFGIINGISINDEAGINLLASLLPDLKSGQLFLVDGDADGDVDVTDLNDYFSPCYTSPETCPW